MPKCPSDPNCRNDVPLLFVQRWASVLEEYATRYQDKVSGWWIDGCYADPPAGRVSFLLLLIYRIQDVVLRYIPTGIAIRVDVGLIGSSGGGLYGGGLGGIGGPKWYEVAPGQQPTRLSHPEHVSEGLLKPVQSGTLQKLSQVGVNSGVWGGEGGKAGGGGKRGVPVGTSGEGGGCDGPGGGGDG